ncbi:MAG TPA: hypothetical protein VGV64_07395 [Thermoplasmata archaeon]|nr:hypothetical protein [Thermoplasmata archaeon]
MAASMNPIAQSIVQRLSAQGTLLMKMRILSFGKNYDVMDANQQVLCLVGLDSGQNVKGQLIGSAVSQVAGDYLGRFVQRSLQYTYTVKSPDGQLALEIRKGSGGNQADFQVVDPVANRLVGTVRMKRSLIGGLKAQWIAPDGPVYLSTKGNIIRRKYEILDGAGQSVGKVRHKILAIRDVWQLELSPGVNHLYSALFATVLDFEKKM